MTRVNIFNPSFCPNSKCQRSENFLKKSVHYLVSPLLSGNFYIRKGIARRQDGSIRQRFKCRICGCSFSDSIFSLNYRLRKRGHISARIFKGVVHNRSDRSLSRELGVSHSTVCARVRRLAQHALLQHNTFLNKITIKEEIAFDGLEAFARSQYEPCNINQAIGGDTLFCYLFNYAPMNRKGRMSDRQRRYLARVECGEGRFDPRALRTTSGAIFNEVVRRKDPSQKNIVLRSDDHFQYRRAIRRDLAESIRLQIEHVTVSSKEARNYKNILFPVNHADLLIRRKVAAMSRETICFSKKGARMMHKYVLYMCYKNYMTPQCVKKQKTKRLSNTESPAMRLGLTKRLYRFHDFFSSRNPAPDLDALALDWKLLYKDDVAYKRSKKFLQKDLKIA
jgi:transposase-like protein